MAKKYVTFRLKKTSKIQNLKQPFIITEKYTADETKKGTELYKKGKKEGDIKRKVKGVYMKGASTLVLEELKQIYGSDIEVTPQFFQNGVIKANEDDVLLLEALRTHDGNQANGGNTFREIDIDKEEKLQLAEYIKGKEAENAVIDASDEVVLTLGVVMYGNHNVTSRESSIRLRLLKDLKNSPFERKPYFTRDRVIEIINDKNIDSYTLVVLALKEQIIEIKNGREIRYLKGEHIFSSSQNRSIVKDFANFLASSEDGLSIASNIAEMLPK